MKDKVPNFNLKHQDKCEVVREMNNCNEFWPLVLSGWFSGDSDKDLQIVL